MSENTEKKALPLGIRILLNIVSVLLCICLFVSLLAAVFILDFRLITSKDTIEQTANSFLCAPEQLPRLKLVAATGVSPATEETAGSSTQDALVEWLFNTLEEQHGEELAVTQEQMQAFLEQSTTKEFLSEKIASYVDDFINGTSNTTLTNEELTGLIEENMAIIETELGIVVDEAAKEQVFAFVEEMKLDEVIRNEVIAGVENLTIPGGTPLFPENAPEEVDPENSAYGGNYTVGALMADLRILTSVDALIICCVIIAVLIVALFFTNRMRLGSTLSCVGIPATVAGILLALPTLLLQLVPEMIPDPLGSTMSILTGAIAPVHYALLAGGIVFLIVGAVVKGLQKK